MTYILSGKLKNSNYLIIDCISANSVTNEKTFINKLSRLESSNSTYFTLTGSPFLDNCVRSYDEWLLQNNNVNDFVDGYNSFNNLIKVIEKNVATYNGKHKLSLGSNRLFFLNSENVVYYDLDYNDGNKLKNIYDKTELNEFDFIDSILFSKKQNLKLDENVDVFEIGKSYLDKMSKGIKFKDRYSFVQIFKNGKVDLRKPFKYYSDYLAMLNEIDYDEIDNDNFIWDI